MNSREINAAIAKACGWTRVNFENGRLYGNPYGLESARGGCLDYCGNLNSIHAAIKTLTFSQRSEYRARLQDLLSGGLKEGLLVDMSECIDASASKRAEAFLRTLNLWKE